MALIDVASIPTAVLLEELARRKNAKPECGSQTGGSYDTPLHIGALVLILLLSTTFCAVPLIPHRGSRSRRTRYAIFICQHFGTGVLLATSFVHLLPTAFTSLTDPCLPWMFSHRYRATAGLVAMLSALAVLAVEQYLSGRGVTHSHSHGSLWDDEDDAAVQSSQLPGVTADPHSQSLSRRRRPSDIALRDVETEGLVAGVSPLPGSTPTVSTAPGEQNHKTDGYGRSDVDVGDSDAESDLDLDADELDPASDEFQTRPLAGGARTISQHVKNASIMSAPDMPSPDEQHRLFVQCLLLEAGILFHSIFIGMALSVETGPTFAVFLLAISFHQSFEGLALGSRIAAIRFPRASLRPWLMVLAFGLTTPLGQLIGLVIHHFYDPKSQTGLLVVGFMNAISAGLLLFAGLVQLLAEDFLTEKSHQTLKGRTRVYAYLSVISGALLMAAVGALKHH